MHGKERVTQVKGVTVGFSEFIRRHMRLTVAVVVAALLVGPMLLAGDGEVFVLNAVGLGLGALLLRRLVRPRGRQRTGRAQQVQRQHTAKATQHEGGHDDDASNDDWWDWDKAATKPGRAGRPADGGAVRG